MTAAAANGQTENEIFLLSVRATHSVVKRNVEGLTQEESLIQPKPAGNCLNWVMGHLLYVYNQVLPALGQTPVMGQETLKRYKRGSFPLTNPGEALELRDLIQGWDEASNRMEAGITGITAKALDAPAPFSPSNNPNETVRSLLTVLLFHQAYHAGQTGLLRRITGKEGAIA